MMIAGKIKLLQSFQRTIRPPPIDNYPDIITKVLSWKAFHNSSQIPEEIQSNVKFVSTTQGKVGGRIGLFNRYMKPSPLLANIAAYLKANTNAIRRASLSLFLSQIPQFLILNLFSSLGGISIVNENGNLSFKINVRSDVGRVAPERVIRTGLKILNIHIRHKLDYIPILVGWSSQLQLLVRSDGGYKSARDLYQIILNESNLYPHHVDLEEERFQNLKSGLHKLARSVVLE